MKTQLLYDGRFCAEARRLKEIRAAVRRAVVAAGCGPRCADDIVMAVDEACQNIIRHGYGGDCDAGIELRIERRGDELRFGLRDHAPPVDPERCEPRDLEDVRPGGLGLHLMREVMDECRYEHPEAGEGNLLLMTKRIDTE